MTAKRAAQRKDQEAASLPEVLIPPGQAKPTEREAYWIDLLQEGNVENLKAAIQTTEFFQLVQEFPEALWGSRLSIYLYGLEDDNGVMVKSAEGKPHYICVVYGPITEEWVAKDKRCGGGKYQAWLKLDNKEVLIKHTFRIAGARRIQPGQTVEVDGKPVPLTPSAQTAQPITQATDLATAVDASRKATESAMEVLSHASETAIDMVKAQSTKEAVSPFATIEGITAIAKILQPAQPANSMADALAIIDRLDAMAARRNPTPAEKEERETPLDETLDVLQKLTGKASIADLLRPSVKAAAEDNYGWVAPVVGAVTNFIDRLPSIMHEARIGRDMEFRRQVWLRSAQPGATPPPELLANNPTPPQNRQPQPTAAQPQPQPGGPPDPTQLTNAIIQTICHGFDTDPTMGGETAATIALLYGKQIEALGLEKFLANEQTLTEYVQGIPALAQRSQFATWPQFQDDFLEYCEQRWGVPESDEPVNGQAKIPPGPQPVA